MVAYTGPIDRPVRTAVADRQWALRQGAANGHTDAPGGRCALAPTIYPVGHALKKPTTREH